MLGERRNIMANTYTQLYIHIVIVVKNREYLIKDSFREELYKYMSGYIANKGHKLIIINGMPDHIHIFIGLNPNDSISGFVKELKRSATNFINEKQWVRGKFAWQDGFAAFSYSHSSINSIYKYIENQKEHHQQLTFKEEYKKFLDSFNVNYDDRYLFEEVLNTYNP